MTGIAAKRPFACQLPLQTDCRWSHGADARLLSGQAVIGLNAEWPILRKGDPCPATGDQPVQPEYLARLSAPMRDFVREVEQAATIDIEVVLDPRLNGGGPSGQGKLAVVIEAQRNLLYVPTNEYFPDGAVRHEVLHVRRFHVDGVPKLALADAEDWDKGLSDALGELDNAIEHILIVPVELRFHPDRRMHWEAVMESVCADLPDVPIDERALAVCMHWTFLQHVLPSSPSFEIVRNFAAEHRLLDVASRFADQFMSVAASKEEVVRLLFLTFPEIPRSRAALEYINSSTGTRQAPIP